MNYWEICVSVGEHTFPLYLQPGFFNPAPAGASLHKHRYTEIHLIAAGNCEYLIGSRKIPLREGQAIAIPAGEFHRCVHADKAVQKTAFQIPFPLREPVLKTFAPNFAQILLRRIRERNKTGNLSAMLAVICAEFFDFSETVRPLRDPAFIIHERIANEYDGDLTLDSIAADLGLSSKQTERLILRYMGSTFRKEIAKRRIEAARHLLETEDVTLSEAAERVGYKSYSGFWKAFKGKS